MLYALIQVLEQVVSVVAPISLCLCGLLLMFLCIHTYRTYVPAEPGETRIAYEVRKDRMMGINDSESKLTNKHKEELWKAITFGVIMFLLVLVSLSNPLYQTPLLAYTGLTAATTILYFVAKCVWLLMFLERYLKRPVPAWLTQFIELLMVAFTGGSVTFYALCVMAFKVGII